MSQGLVSRPGMPQRSDYRVSDLDRRCLCQRLGFGPHFEKGHKKEMVLKKLIY